MEQSGIAQCVAQKRREKRGFAELAEVERKRGIQEVARTDPGREGRQDVLELRCICCICCICLSSLSCYKLRGSDIHRGFAGANYNDTV